eukprot:g3932.t1
MAAKDGENIAKAKAQSNAFGVLAGAHLHSPLRAKPRSELERGAVPIPDEVREKLTWRHPHTLAGSSKSGTVKQSGRSHRARDVAGIEVDLRTAIMTAPAWKSRDMVETALRGGATRVNKRNPANGHALLHSAAAKGNGELVKLLLHEFGADPNVSTYLGGDKPLLYAAQAGARQVVFFLLVAGANVRAANRLGQTALHLASSKNTARVLIEWGANVWARDKFGHTPLDRALERGDDQVAELIGEIAQEMLIAQAEGDATARHRREHQQELDAKEKAEAARTGKNIKTRPALAERLKREYAEWRKGELGRGDKQKEKRLKEARQKTATNLSVFHSRLPGQYLGKARSTALCAAGQQQQYRQQYHRQQRQQQTQLPQQQPQQKQQQEQQQGQQQQQRRRRRHQLGQRHDRRERGERVAREKEPRARHDDRPTPQATSAPAQQTPRDRTLLHTARPDGARTARLGGGSVQRVGVDTMISVGKGATENQDSTVVHAYSPGSAAPSPSVTTGGAGGEHGVAAKSDAGDAGDAGSPSPGSSTTLLVGVFDGHGDAGHKVSRAAAQALQQSLGRQLRGSPKGRRAEDGGRGGRGGRDGRDGRGRVRGSDGGGGGGGGGGGKEDSGEKASRAMYNALKSCAPALQRSTIDTTFSGTTAVAALRHRGHLVVGNIGDSRAVLGRRVRVGGAGGGRGRGAGAGASHGADEDSARVKAVPLSVDHTPEYDRERLKKINGRVHPSIVPAGPNGAPCYMGPSRVWDSQGIHGLAMARSLGDTHLAPFVVAEPEVTHKKLDRDDKFIIVASDGLWDCVDSQEAVEIAAKHTKPQAAASALTRVARQRWKQRTQGCMSDDITVSVARL